MAKAQPNGATLKRLRERAGISGAELSRRVGRNRTWVSKVETTHATLTPQEALALAAALDVAPEELGVSKDASPLRFNVEAMRQACKRRKLPIQKLAALVGVHVTNAYRWIHQGQQPSERTVQLIAETLELPLDQLYIEEKGVNILAPDAGDAVKPRPDALQTSGDVVLVPMSAATYARLQGAIEAVEGHSISPVSLSALRALQASLAEVLPS